MAENVLNIYYTSLLKICLLSDLNIIEIDHLAVNVIINKVFANGTTMLSGGQRMYTDEEVAHLPCVSRNHPLHKEWKIRGRSFKRLTRQLQDTGSSLNILEVGCGNGWLAAKLAAITSGEVTGIGINMEELLQARRVFGSVPNLDFVAKDIFRNLLPDKRYDIIVFAASIQYFSSLKEIIGNAIEHLTLHGQIHILDSSFYPVKTDHHFTHHIHELESFQYKIIYDPAKLINRLFAGKNSFYHIVIKNRYH
jgi:ubiquinone/menaquinone biosynthesis C-methylase UbiE